MFCPGTRLYHESSTFDHKDLANISQQAIRKPRGPDFAQPKILMLPIYVLHTLFQFVDKDFLPSYAGKDHWQPEGSKPSNQVTILLILQMAIVIKIERMKKIYKTYLIKLLQVTWIWLLQKNSINGWLQLCPRFLLKIRRHCRFCYTETSQKFKLYQKSFRVYLLNIFIVSSAKPFWFLTISSYKQHSLGDIIWFPKEPNLLKAPITWLQFLVSKLTNNK